MEGINHVQHTYAYWHVLQLRSVARPTSTQPDGWDRGNFQTGQPVSTEITVLNLLN